MIPACKKMWKLYNSYQGDLNILSDNKKISACNSIIELMKEFLYVMHISSTTEKM